MTLEDTIRQILREELDRAEPRLADRVAEKVRGAATASSAGDRLLRLTEAQELFGYAPETFRKWIGAGKLTRFGTVRATRVSEREVRALLAATERAKAGETPLTDAAIVELARERAARGR